jgi:alpha-L-rhamnosidase
LPRRSLALGALAAAAGLVLGLAPQTSAAAPQVRVTGLQTEAQSSPLGIDVPRPRLSWRMESSRRGVLQSAYRVRVSRSLGNARKGEADVWDSTRRRTSTPFVDYAGSRLSPRTRYFWTVELWDEKGRPVRRSGPSWFETAFTAAGQWRASWIGGKAAPAGCADERQCRPAPLLREEFRLKAPVASARLYASGLGYGTYHLNGRRVSEDVLSPGFTEYSERALYVTYDVTRLLRKGNNAIGAVLGRGPFGSTGSNFAGYAAAPWHADPQLRLELHVRLEDGSTTVIRSGKGWRTTDGPTRFDDYMLGETYDARRAAAVAGWSKPGYDDSGWVPVRPMAGPRGRLEAMAEEPIRPHESLPFRSVTKTSAGTWLFDLKQNVAGNAVLRTDLPAGTRITLHYGERLADDGTVDTSGGSFDGKPMQLDTFTAGPGRDVWRPEHTYKGFRYVEVAGLTGTPKPSMLTAQVWHTGFRPVGTFTSSHPLVNRVFEASRRAMRSNSLSIPTDTPIYEKTGYTADGQLVAGALSYLYDTRRFYAKWLRDIEQSVAPNGDMGISAPLPSDPPETQGPNGFAYASPGWDAALMVVPHVLERMHGDARPGLAALSEMKRVLAYYDTQSRGDLLPATCQVAFSQVCPNGLGDWTAPFGMSYGAALDSNAWWLYMLDRAGAVAQQAGERQTAADLATRIAAVRSAFQTLFYDRVLKLYRDPLNPGPSEPARPFANAFITAGASSRPSTEVSAPGIPLYSQHQNAIALGLGLVPAAHRTAVGDNLALDMSARGDHLSTGIMGTRFLFEALASTGHVDEAFRVLTQTTYPSYGYSLGALGYSSLPEFWESNQRSLNHQMYGSVVQWMFEGLAGIRPLRPGFAQVEIDPGVPSQGLSYVRASTATVRGTVSSEWRTTPNGLVLDVRVPANTTAVVRVPAAQGAEIKESGSGRTLPAAEAPGVRLVARTADRVSYVVGSGTYRFVTAS